MKFLALILTYLICLNSFAAPSMGVTGQNQSPAKYPSVVKAPNNQVTDLGASSVLMENGNKNRLINPGFEHSTFTTGWTTSVTSTATITPVVNTATPIEGKKSAQYTCAGGASGGVCTIYQDATTSYAVQGNAGVYVKTDTVYDGVNLKGPKIWSRVNGVNSQSKNIDSAIKWWEIPVTLGTTSTGVAIEITVAASQTIVVTLDEAFVGAEALRVNGAIVTEWTAFTPVISGSTSNPTRATGATEKAYWRRVGDSMEITYFYTQSASTGAAAGSGNYLWALPLGYTIDTNKISNNTGGTLVVGPARVFNGAGAAWYTGTVFPYSTTQLAILVQGTAYATPNVVGSGWAPITNNPAMEYSYTAKVPIIGWGSSSSTYSSTNADTDWAACNFSTLAWQGFGTVTSNLMCRRAGRNLIINGKATLGTVAASIGQIPLPTWAGVQLITASTAIVPNPISGGRILRILANSSVPKDYNTIVTAGTGSIGVSYPELSSGITPLSAQNGSALFNSGEIISLENVTIPIEGWDNSNVIIGQFNGLESCTTTDSCTDTFRAYVNTSGAISRTNISNWITSGAASTGVYSVTFASNAFPNSLPVCSCNNEQGNARGCTINIVSNTSATVVTYTAANTLASADFSISCSRTGTDAVFKTARAVASDQNVKSIGSIGVDIQSVYFGSGANCASSCATTPCTICKQVGSKITSVTRTTTGTYNLNGIDGTKYFCQGNAFGSTSGNTVIHDLANSTSSLAYVQTYNGTSAQDTRNTVITCMGTP